MKKKSGKEIKGKVERERQRPRQRHRERQRHDKEIRDLSPQVVQVVWKV